MLKKFLVGELVKWYEHYSEAMIVKDSGLGVVISVNTYREQIYFKIHRVKHKDIMFFYLNNIEKIYKEQK